MKVKIPTSLLANVNSSGIPNRRHEPEIKGEIQPAVCRYCGKRVTRNQGSHLKLKHSAEWDELVDKMVEWNNEGYSIEQIATRVNLGVGLVKVALQRIIEVEPKRLTGPIKSIKRWEPDDFQLEATTLWSFPRRGNWATHRGDYRGNYSPFIPRNIILRYSTEGDRVLDPFVGSGTTLVETKLLRRHGIGFDINEDAVLLAKQRTDFRYNDEYQPKILVGDARDLTDLKDQSVDLICTHPPYANIIQYSNGDIPEDLSNLDIPSFLMALGTIAREFHRVLKPGKYLALLIGDTRKNKKVVPLGMRTMNIFLEHGFTLKEFIIKEQHNCQATGFWYQKSIKYNFLLLGHEYLFVFERNI